MEDPVSTTRASERPGADQAPEGPNRVLAVDDDPGIRHVVKELLRPHGFEVLSVGTGREALIELRRGFRGVVVLDVRLPDLQGPDVFQAMRKFAPENPVIFLTGFGSADLALDSIRRGAFEFLDKDSLGNRLVGTVRNAFARLESEAPPKPEEPAGPAHFPEIITGSPQMAAVFRTLNNAIASNVTVLISGESGTGKELIARAIHSHGTRATGPFVAINCAGIPENLLEAEIFGYERGAFTGAHSRKPGKFELADGGTLMLDEIGEMHPSLQAKLLRLIQDGEYQRLGGTETLHADVRVLSATHRDLEAEVKAGRFREDLYFRLAVFTVYIPPLRERVGDVPLLVDSFVERFAEREGKQIEGVDRTAMELLKSYTYPGNVRELENVLSYAVVSAKGPVLAIVDLPPNFLHAVSVHRREHVRRPVGALPGPPVVYIPKDGKGGADQGATVPVPPEGSRVAHRRLTPASLPAFVGPVRPGPILPPARPADTPFPTLGELEKKHIRAAMERADGNKTEAARLLGISRVTLYRKLKDLDLGG